MREANLDRLKTVYTDKKSRNYLSFKYLFDDLKHSFLKYAKGDLLDIGCGNKPYSIFLNHLDKYVGCDIIQSSENKVDIICPATEIPLEDETFDTVISTQTIEHVYDHKKMVNEAYRLVKKGGYVIMSGPMFWPHHEVPYDFYRFTRYGFSSIFEEAGFKIINIKSNGGKWALWGLITLHVVPFAGFRPIKWFINTICEKLDSHDSEDLYTSNFVIVAQK